MFLWEAEFDCPVVEISEVEVVSIECDKNRIFVHRPEDFTK